MNMANMVVTAQYCCSIIWISLISLKVHSQFFVGEGLIYKKCVKAVSFHYLVIKSNF